LPATKFPLRTIPARDENRRVRGTLSESWFQLQRMPWLAGAMVVCLIVVIGSVISLFKDEDGGAKPMPVGWGLLALVCLVGCCVYTLCVAAIASAAMAASYAH
jgi:hypothetical protein